MPPAQGHAASGGGGAAAAGEVLALLTVPGADGRGDWRDSSVGAPVAAAVEEPRVSGYRHPLTGAMRRAPPLASARPGEVRHRGCAGQALVPCYS
jgi:hypothetical protein